MPAPLVKICCIASAQEAALAIARTVPSPMETFLLTSLREPSDIAAQHQRCATTTIQLVDHLPPSTHAALRTLLPGVTLVQVVHVVDAESVAYAIDAADGVDALLLDSGNPTLAVRELGGTGRVHDWRLSRAIRDRVPLPVWLAGGLRAHNVQEAIATVQPLGLDLCTGVRTDGWLDEAKLAAFMAAVRG